jgi:hypothetical protein
MDEGSATGDPFERAVATVRDANGRGIPLKLLGGQAVRLLCPLFPHRARKDQDMDFCCVSSKKKDVIEYFTETGFVGDRKFNLLHGDRQMYFTTADGSTSVDVIMDKLNMCHVLEFSDRIDRMPDTLDVADLLLSKLQVVELNEKDVHDALHLLSAYEVREGDEPGTIGLDRIGQIVSGDWGWYRTVTMNLDKLAHFAADEHRDLVPEARTHDPASQAQRVRQHCDDVPKPMKWKLRAKVGDRVQWFQEPEEVAH